MKIVPFWKRIKALIKEKHITQAEAAKIGRLPFNTLKAWMSRGTIPSLDVAYNLARYFGVTLEYLISGKEADMAAQIDDVLLSLKRTEEKLKKVRNKASLS